MNSKFILLACLMMWSSAAAANQGCPEGTVFTGRMLSAPGISYPECAPAFQQSQQPQQPQQPQRQQPQSKNGYWDSRWGSIAQDSSEGVFGTANNHATMDSAQNDAIKQCKAAADKGGKNCITTLTYSNVCGAFAAGADGNVVMSADRLEIATELAMMKCSRKTSNCKIHYSACSPRAWVAR